MYGSVKALGPVAAEVSHDVVLAMASSVVGGELGCNDHLITVVSLLHPFAEPLLRFLKLIVVCRVDEVPCGVCLSILNTPNSST
jgi:hypothetical protein